MGYCTSYYVTVYDEKGNIETDADRIVKIAIQLARRPYWSHDSAESQESYEKHLDSQGVYAIDELVSTDVHTWYDYCDDMLAISLMFPDQEFVVQGKGEDYDDFWRHYFKNGKEKFCKGCIRYDSAPDWSKTDYYDTL